MHPPTAVPLPDHLRIFELLHGAMRRDVARLTRALRARAGADDAPAAADLRNWFAAFRDALGHHHRLEDDHYWPALRDRAPGATDVEASMHRQHEALEAALAEVARRLEELVAAGDDDVLRANATAVEAAERLADVLTGHLADEETTALTLLGEHVPVADLAAVDVAAQRAAGLGYVRFALPWLLDGLTDAEAQPLLDASPAPFRWLLRLRWGPRYRHLTAALGD